MRRTTPRSVTLMLAPNAAFTAGYTSGRPARQPDRRDRRPPAHPLLLAGQRRGRPAPRADDRHPRRRAGLRRTCTSSPARHGGRPDRRRRRLRPAGTDGPAGSCSSPAAAASRPVMSMLRTLVAEGHQTARSRSSTTRARRRRPATATSSPRMPGVRVLHGYTRSRLSGELDGRFGPTTWRRRCRRRTPCSSAGRRLWSTPSATHCDNVYTRRASCRRCSTLPAEPVGRTSHVRATAASTPSTTAARCSSRPKRPA